MKLFRTGLAAALALLLLPTAGALSAQSHAHPKLVVLIAVDQMRGDYPVRYASLFNKGLTRLTTKGAWYKNGAYPYLNTVTCVGHSTIGTGSFPYKHGMIQNVWFDRDSGKTVACTSDSSVHDLVAGAAAGETSSLAGDSAARMLVPTLAEIMKRDLKARVVTMSMKARAAIGLAGHTGDAVLWLDDRGRLETSSAYGGSVPAWATTFGERNPIQHDANKVWERTLPVDRYQYSDEPPGEKPGGGWSAAFPHPLGAANDSFFSRWERSPYSDEYLEKLAERAVDELKLGQEDHPDFLGISFSAVDVVGHSFGPRSHEIQDTLVRLDATLARLMDFLDAKVGAGNYVLALGADHGVADVPEQIEHAGRIISKTVAATIDAALKPAYGDGPFVVSSSANDFYLKNGVYDRLRNDAPARAALTTALEAMPGVERVLFADDVSPAAARASKDLHLRAAALSYFPGRSGDLLVVPKENWIFGTSTTTHGTWYSYDQQVPVLFYGAGIKAGVRTEAASPADLAATLASLVGVHLPSPDGHVLTSAFGRAAPARRRK